MSLRKPEFGLTPSRKGGKGGARKRELSEDQQNEINEAFALFDSDHTGAIDYHELKVAMRALGFDVKKEEVKKLISEYDREGNGTVSADDFLEISTSQARRSGKRARARSARLFRPS